ncbi:hypothetical protein Tco_0910113 [Tanacetum coccineum]|uniref:Uncharacterized protein n=1 Tax=Tanacetum coccineum TaxID=301880 RepID=A0ABQ5CU90_9ASTR
MKPPVKTISPPLYGSNAREIAGNITIVSLDWILTGIFKFPLTLVDQEKTTFTMSPKNVCLPSACLSAYAMLRARSKVSNVGHLHDMVEKTREVFKDTSRLWEFPLKIALSA